jgi:hypothetical protein
MRIYLECQGHNAHTAGVCLEGQRSGQTWATRRGLRDFRDGVRLAVVRCFGGLARAASNLFSSVLARWSLPAAAFNAVRPFPAASSRSASCSSFVQ